MQRAACMPIRCSRCSYEMHAAAATATAATSTAITYVMGDVERRAGSGQRAAGCEVLLRDGGGGRGSKSVLLAYIPGVSLKSASGTSAKQFSRLCNLCVLTSVGMRNEVNTTNLQHKYLQFFVIVFICVPFFPHPAPSPLFPGFLSSPGRRPSGILRDEYQRGPLEFHRAGSSLVTSSRLSLLSPYHPIARPSPR